MSFAGINRLSGSRRSAGFGGEWKKQHRGRKEIRDGDYNASFALFWGFVRRLPGRGDRAGEPGFTGCRGLGGAALGPVNTYQIAATTGKH